MAAGMGEAGVAVCGDGLQAATPPDDTSSSPGLCAAPLLAHTEPAQDAVGLRDLAWCARAAALAWGGPI